MNSSPIAFAAGLLIPKEKLQTAITKICADKPITAPDVLALAETVPSIKRCNAL